MKKIKQNNSKTISKEYFDFLYQNNYTPLCRYAFYITNQKEVAEEIVQEVFLNIWEKRKKLHFESDPKSYLYISVRNYAYSKIKQLNKYRFSEVIPDIDLETVTTFNDSAFLEQLYLAIKHLPEKCREIYCLKHLEGLTYKEIASYLSISEKTVESQVYNALVKLRLKLIPIRHKFYSNDKNE